MYFLKLYVFTGCKNGPVAIVVCLMIGGGGQEMTPSDGSGKIGKM